MAWIHYWEDHSRPDLWQLPYMTPDDEMMAMILHLPQDKYRLYDEQSAHSVKEQIAEFKIDNRSVWDFWSDLQEHWSVFICQTAQVQEGWQWHILCPPLQKAGPKSHQCNSIRCWVSAPDVSIWWKKEGMELGKVCCPTCQVPYYPLKPYGILAPRPWSRMKSLIPVDWHQVWQIVHSSCHIEGAPRHVQQGFQCSSHLSHPVYWH